MGCYPPIPRSISCTSIQVSNVFGVEEKRAKFCLKNFTGESWGLKACRLGLKVRLDLAQPTVTGKVTHIE